MIPVLIWDFYLYRNSTEKMNISKVTALWAPYTLWEAGHSVPQPHGVAQAHAWTLDTRAISRSLAQYRTVDLEGKVKKISEFTGIEGEPPTLHRIYLNM